jgi:hypothetical protein
MGKVSRSCMVTPGRRAGRARRSPGAWRSAAGQAARECARTTPRPHRQRPGLLRSATAWAGRRPQACPGLCGPSRGSVFMRWFLGTLEWITQAFSTPLYPRWGVAPRSRGVRVVLAPGHQGGAAPIGRKDPSTNLSARPWRRRRGSPGRRRRHRRVPPDRSVLAAR